jgi:hypothetical protein
MRILVNFSNSPPLEGLGYKLSIDNRTDEIHPQQMPLSPVAIPLAYDFERFDFCVDVFNDNPLTR